MTRSQFNKKVKTWLVYRRDALGLTQAELSKETGLTQDWISHFENGRRTPDAFAFFKLQQFLGGFPA